MSKMKMDAVDASLLVLNSMAGFLIVGIGTFNLFDVDFAASLFTFGGYDLSTAWIIGFGAVIGTIITNDNTEFSSLSDDIRSLETYYAGAAAATIALPIAFIVFPSTVGDFFQSADLWGLLYVVIMTTGQFALGWLL